MPEKHRHAPNKRPEDNDVHRARTILASFREGEAASADVFDGLWQLDELPVDDVHDALAAIGARPEPHRIDKATRLAHGLPLPPLRLRTLSVAKDADIFDLGPEAEEQLRVAGKSWDGADLSAEERLDGEIEGSFAGTVERRVLADADDAAGATPLFDVLLFAEDSGIVFAAGTTKIVALIAYGKVEMRDRRTRTAIEDALAAESPTAAVEAPAVNPAVEAPAVIPAVVEEPVAPAPERTVAKKAAVKKAAKTKAAPTPKAKPSVKAKAKAPAKKTSAKKAGAKKTSAKKTSAKKKATTKPKPAAKRGPAARPKTKKAR